MWSLLSSRSVPLFPKAEWKNVLCGSAINLDAVFSGSFSTLADNKTTTSVGGFELVFGGTKPSKTVQTHGDWTIAWNATAAAVRYVFPHWAEELELYTQYIIQFFGAFPPGVNHKVINLDKAVRKYVREVHNLKHSSVGYFRHLESCYLQSDGLGSSSYSIQKEKMDFR
jgi:hypothetical protein